MKAPERLRAVVKGRVQGVGFRWFVMERARGLGLNGEVYNRRDGAVEVLAEGFRPELEQLEAELREGPMGADVARVEAEWGAATGRFGSFDIGTSR